MRTNLIILAGILIAAALLTMMFDGLKPIVPEKPAAPAFSFTSLEGKTHALEDFKDKTVILNFWASWCPPCVKEFPILLQIAEKHKDKAVLIALSSDMDDAAIKKFLAAQKIKSSENVIIARDAANISGDLFKTYQLPETFVIDHDMRIRAKFTGADWQQSELESHIE
jgi:cytochrome c biogenesis protein CcmG, thiol:disulfide interchange protein DsbE